MNEEIKEIRRKVVPILKKYGVVKAGIFGSYARGEQKKRSDVDILIKFKRAKSLLEAVGFEIDLKKKIRREVDLLTYGAISPYLKKRILKEEVAII